MSRIPTWLQLIALVVVCGIIFGIGFYAIWTSP